MAKPRHLTRAVQILCALLRERAAIGEKALVDRLVEACRTAGESTSSDGVLATDNPQQTSQLEIRTGPLSEITSFSLENIMGHVRARLFAARGVVAPTPVQIEDRTLKAGEAVIKWNVRQLEKIALQEDAEELGAAFERHAAELISPLLIKHYLVRIKETKPALVKAVRDMFTAEQLIPPLRTRLERGDSILDFAAELEEILVTSNPLPSSTAQARAE